ncbi:MAG: hypothetical protein HY377_02455 [Candidatus Blackburnbacteria bacterium]|nr:hypothetical protein [Candidatus Blackburnbacteria bacterium]
MAARRKSGRSTRSRRSTPRPTRTSRSDRNIITLAGILIVGVAAYFLYTAQVAEQEAKMKLEAMKTATVTLGAQNNSKEMGTATLKEVDGKVTVTLDLTGTPKGVSQPAHIHTGSCPNPGAIKYPLTNVVDGKSETTLDVTMDRLRSELPLAVNIHKSAAQSKVYVSCGNLPEK